MTSKKVARREIVSWIRYLPNGHVEGGRQYLAVVPAELDTSHALGVRLLESPQALSALNSPDLYFTVLRAAGEHLAVPTESHRQHRLLHHHEIVLRLVLKVLSYLAGREIPYLDETVHRAGDQVLSVWREARALDVRLLTELYLLRQLCRILLVLLISNSGFTAKQVDRRARGEETLVLLPLESLAE